MQNPPPAYNDVPPSYDDVPPNYNDLGGQQQDQYNTDYNNNNNNYDNSNLNQPSGTDAMGIGIPQAEPNGSSIQQSSNIYQQQPSAAYNPSVEYPNLSSQQQPQQYTQQPVNNNVAGSGGGIQAPNGMQAGQMMQVQMPDGTIQYMMAVPQDQDNNTQIQSQVQAPPQQQVSYQQPVTYGNNYNNNNYAPSVAPSIAPSMAHTTVSAVPNGNVIQTNIPAGGGVGVAGATVYNDEAAQQRAAEIKKKQQRGMVLIVIGIILMIVGSSVDYVGVFGLIIFIWGCVWACNCCQGGASNPNARVQTVVVSQHQQRPQPYQQHNQYGEPATQQYSPQPQYTQQYVQQPQQYGQPQPYYQ